MNTELPACAKCAIKIKERLCMQEDGKSSSACPTKNHPSAIEKAQAELQKPEILEFAKQASIQEGEGYADKDHGYEHVKPIKPRIVETIEFARKMNYQRLGLVFCIGLWKEAKVVEKLLSTANFDVISALCKLGRTPKEAIGVRDD
ncbi:MAG: DUF1847 domain-containing protein, partial [Desulfobacterales bacterium]